MYKFCILNSIIPKIPKITGNENLYAKRKNWYTDGSLYKHNVIRTCSSNEDCNASQLCIDNHCFGLNRQLNLHGVHYGPEYKHIIQSNHPLAHLLIPEYTNDSGFFSNQPDDEQEYDNHGYNYDYDHS
jgi:hypothetical protein